MRSAMLKPGGVLVYCTCSLEAAEGPEQIARTRVGAPGPQHRRPSSPSEIGGRAEWIDARARCAPCPYLQLSDPDLSGMDGFYAARLRKAG